MNARLLFLWTVCLLALAGLSGCQSAQTRRQSEAIEKMEAVLNDGIDEARRKAQADPGSFSSMILDRLRKTKRYVDQVETGEKPFDLEEMLALTRKTMVLVENLKLEFKLVLSADVAFRLGGYEADDLLADGRRILDEFADSILEAQIPEYQEKFPDVPLMVALSITGYADSVPSAKALARELLAGQTEPVPGNPAERRRHLNRLLSIRRSQTINRHLQNRLRSGLQRAGVSMGPPSVKGMGESFPTPPDAVTPAYRARDERRRICKIYSNILIR